MIGYIDDHREEYGVEPICQTLEIAPSTYYARKSRPSSGRQRRDEELKRKIAQIHQDNFGVYGVEKVWRQLVREGIESGRDRVGRLMRSLGLAGAVRGKVKRTTIPGGVGERPGDLVNRVFGALAPNRLWVADLTYVATHAGFVYVALVIDVYSRYIVGWRVSTSLHAEITLDALEMAIWARGVADLKGLVHHSDRGVQYLAVRYTERLEEMGAACSVGSKGDSYDNALAETVNGLYKTEVIHRGGPWRGAEQIELATGKWVGWWNHDRLHSGIGYVPPAEFEAGHQKRATEVAA